MSTPPRDVDSSGLAASIRRQLCEPAVHTIAIQLVGAIASFLVYFTIVQRFGAAISGEYALFVQTVVAGSSIALFGYDQKVMRSVAHYTSIGEIDRAGASLRYHARRMLLASFGVAALLLAGRPLLEPIGFGGGALWVLPGAMVAYSALRLTTAALRGARQVRVSQTLLAVPPLLMLAFTAAFRLASSDEQAQSTTLAGIYAISVTLPLCIALVLLRRLHSEWQARRPIGPATPLPKEGEALGLSVLIPTVATWAGFAAIGYYIDTTEIAAYQLCILLTTPFNMIRTTYIAAVAPELTDALARDDWRRLWSLQRTHQRVLLAVGAVPLVMLAGFAGLALHLVGPELADAEAALRVFALGMLLNLSFGSVATTLVMAGHDREFLRITLRALAIWAVVLLVTLPALGVLGAAIAYLLQILVTQGSALQAVRRLRPLSGSMG